MFRCFSEKNIDVLLFRAQPLNLYIVYKINKSKGQITVSETPRSDD